MIFIYETSVDNIKNLELSRMTSTHVTLRSKYLNKSFVYNIFYVVTPLMKAKVTFNKICLKKYQLGLFEFIFYIDFYMFGILLVASFFELGFVF